jgi:CBS domain containing-hemolysin-like protein
MNVLQLSAWVVGCVVLEGFFTGTEMALLSANRTALMHRADQGEAGAMRAIAFLGREERLLATCLIGTNLALVTGTTLATAAWWLSDSSLGWMVLVGFVPLSLVFGEAVPKMIYAAHADSLAPVLVYPLRAFEVVFTPFLAVIAGWSKLLRTVAPRPERPVEREDIMQAMSDRSSNIDPEDRRLIQRAFALGEIPVEHSMTPLVDLSALPETATVGDAIKLVIADGWSRIPVYRDRVDNLVGVVDHRDLLFAPEAQAISEIVRPVRFVPESKKVDEMLRELRQSGDHIAVIVDEYGGSVGIVTVPDLLENLLGDIRDERDEPEGTIRKTGDREWRISGRATLDEVSAAVGRRLPEGDYETIAGMILQRLGRIPAAGETVKVGRFQLLVEEASDRAVLQVKLQAPEGPLPHGE